MPRHRIHLETQTADDLFAKCGFAVRRRVTTPYGWGAFFTDYLEHYQASGEKLKERLSLRHQLRAWTFFFAGQSGNALYYVTKA